MIHLLNRRELLVTYDTARFNAVRDALAAAGIDYQYRVKDLTAPGLTARGRRGTLGIDHTASLEYKLYVHKADHPKAARYL